MVAAYVAHGERGRYAVVWESPGWRLTAVEPNGWRKLELPPDGRVFELLREAQEHAERIDTNRIRAGELSGC